MNEISLAGAVSAVSRFAAIGAPGRTGTTVGGVLR
jgi:hypothetical protein